MYLPPGVRHTSFSGHLIFRWSAVKFPSITTLLLYNQLLPRVRKQTDKNRQNGPLAVISPIIRKVYSWLRTGWTEDGQGTWLNGGLSVMAMPSLYPCNNVPPDPGHTHQLPVPVLEISLLDKTSQSLSGHTGTECGLELLVSLRSLLKKLEADVLHSTEST